MKKEVTPTVADLHDAALRAAEALQFTEAQAYLEQAISQDANDPLLFLHLANIFKASGQHEKALSILLDLIVRFPKLAAAYNNLGTVYAVQGNYEAAVKAYLTAIQCQADYVDAYYNLGLAYVKLPQLIEAMNAFQAVMSFSPAHPGAAFQLGCLFMRRENYTEAVKHLLLVETAYPFHAETKINLASCYLSMGLYAEAKSYYLKSLDLTPNDTQVLFNLGVIAMQQNAVQEAMNYYQRALAVDGDNFAAHNNLGVAYLAIKDREAALLHFQAALRLLPDNQAVRHCVDILKHEKKLSSSPPEYIRALFDDYAPRYDAHLLQTLHYQVPQIFLEMLQPFLPSAPFVRVLDLGCGTGLCGEVMRPYAKQLDGVDLSEKMLASAAAKKLYDHLSVQEMGAYLRLHPQHYDLIVAADVLVYVGDLADVLAAIAKALKQHGLLIFNVEAGDGASYAMTDVGRFVHSRPYLDGLVVQGAWEVLATREAVMREQDGVPAIGHVYLLRRLP